ncbi:MAG: hypothetical protein H6636_07425 [Anaerolineales bacterium]|nr:hypothetical protein [Anaerolineales bacterium]
MNNYPKHIKRLLRELAAEAYEKELARELTRLDKNFSEWREEKISSGELSYRVHQYETGASRELFHKYNQGENDFNVAYALVTGILNQQEIPGELIEAIDKQIRFYEALKNADELRLPGE